MSQRVIQWSTGNVGAYALRAILSHPELELAGVWVHSEKKSGRDAGELCGIGPVGVAATNDADALLELDADCVCYTATADLRLMEAVDDVCRILRSGKNVVSSSLVPLVHPSQLGPDVQKRLEEACTAGDVSVWFSGIDPGFANDVLPLALSGLSESWTQIRAREVVNYATYNQPEVVLGTMGFGKPMDELPILLQPGTLTVAWGGTIRLLAEGLGLSLDEIRQHYECLPAPRAVSSWSTSPACTTTWRPTGLAARAATRSSSRACRVWCAASTWRTSTVITRWVASCSPRHASSTPSRPWSPPSRDPSRPSTSRWSRAAGVSPSAR
jgi:4-hydroxy-tetrahydrodipicolinate reductase